MSEILDSGDRRQFFAEDGKEGAVRDMAEGKGRFDLTALDVVADLVYETYHEDNNKGYALTRMATYQEKHQLVYIKLAILRLIDEKGIDVSTAMIEYSKHAEKGSAKYGEHNVEKGIPTHSLLDSAARHYIKWLRGDDDEDHWVACLWNLMWLVWMAQYKPEFDDIGRGN